MIRVLKYVFLFFHLVQGLALLGQDGKGSLLTDNSRLLLAEGTMDIIYVERINLGPNADWEINGDLYIYSKEFWIAPTAKLRGSGRLIFKNPGSNPFYNKWLDQPTLVDGNNGQKIDVNIVIENNNNLKLNDLSNPGYVVTAGVDNIATLNMGANIDFSVQGGDIQLNGFQLALGAESQLLNSGNSNVDNQNIKGYIVTDNILESHVSKEMKAGERFLFPVGINEKSYTPAIIAPQRTSRVYVGLVDYAASNIVSIEDKDIGMDRIWHIYANEQLFADYTLIHQAITQGTMYLDNQAEIMQYSGGGNWIGDVTKLESAGVHTRKDLLTYAVPTLDGTWITKMSFLPPDAQDDSYTLAYADSYKDKENVFYILQNDKAGSTPILVSSVQIMTNPLHGILSVNSDGSVSYQPNRGFVGKDSFRYRITDEKGLSDEADVGITVMSRDLHIPNVITPNGDGYNDNFVIIGYEQYDHIQITIVNRWGNEVYRSRNYNNTWNGEGLTEGTYFYIIEAVKNNDKRVFKGDVLIKRN